MSGKNWKCSLCNGRVFMHEVKWIVCANCPDKTKEKIADLEKKVEELVGLLKELEYPCTEEGADCNWCRICQRSDWEKHLPNCRLKQALDRMAGKDGG